ncbi:hypothetical protein BDW22DRAFT_1333253 [Trametopsis cervina]|nr:hypothetical protein BDW22DRAFT_1333253 [Trametopsis cervina]
MSIASEIAIIATLAYPDAVSLSPEVYQSLCPRNSHDIVGLQSVSSVFTLGALLAISGGALRVWCYRVLGSLFTYEVTLRPAHTLVRQAPYNTVRHPSYTALILQAIGTIAVLFSPGAWSRECGIMHTKAGPFVILWPMGVAYTCVSVWRRGALEDDLLRKRFGSVWEEYAREVPWKFFPWIA